MPIRTWNEALHRVNLKIVDVERVHVLVYHIFAYLAGLLGDMVIILDIVLDLGWLHLDVDLERLEAVLIRTLIEALHRVNFLKKVDVERVHVVLVYHIFAYLVGLLRDMAIILDIVLELG